MRLLATSLENFNPHKPQKFDIETISKEIDKRNLQNPVLRKFVRAIGKNPDDYDNMAVFWEDLEKLKFIKLNS